MATNQTTLENSRQNALDTFVDQIKAIATQIIMETKKLAQMELAPNEEFENIEEEFILNSKKTAEETFKLTKSIQDYFIHLEKEPTVSQRFMKDSSKQVQRAVIELVKTKKNHLVNPLGFSSQQELDNSCKRIVTGIKNILSAITSLQTSSDSSPESSSSSNSSSSSSSSKDTEPVKLSESFVKTIDEIIDQVNKISEGVKNETFKVEEFLELIKSTVFKINEVLEDLENLNLEDLQNKLKDSTLSFIGAAKQVFKNPKENTEVEVLEVSSINFVENLKQVLFQSSILSKHISNSISNHSFSTARNVPKKKRPLISTSISVPNSPKPEHNPPPAPNSSKSEIIQSPSNTNITMSPKPETPRILLTQTSDLNVSTTESLPSFDLVKASIVSKILYKLRERYPDFRLMWERSDSTYNVETVRVLENQVTIDEIMMDYVKDLVKKQYRSSPTGLTQSSSPLSTQTPVRKPTLTPSHSRNSSSSSADLSSKRLLSNGTRYPQRTDSITSVDSEYVELKKIMTSSSLADISDNYDETTSNRISVAFSETELDPVTAFNNLKSSTTMITDVILGVIAQTKVYLEHSASETGPFVLTEYFQVLKSVLLLTKCSFPLLNFVSNISQSCQNYLENQKNYQAKVSPYLVKAVEYKGIQSLLNRSASTIKYYVDGLLASGSQLITSIQVIAQDVSSPQTSSIILHIFATIRTLAKLVCELHEEIEKYSYLSSRTEDEQPEMKLLANKPDVSVWDEKALVVRKNGILYAGTLNHIILDITSAEKLDTKTIRTFVATYRSFSNPSEVLEKLIQRYQVPEKAKTLEEPIQFRVCVVLQQLLRTHFLDFYRGSIKNRMQEFLTKIVKDSKMRAMLQSEIDKKVWTHNFQKKKVSSFFQKIQDLKKSPELTLEVPSDILALGRKSPLEIFMDANDAEVARQLTLIESNLFSKIQTSELLNQAWNKLELKWRAQNVLEMISRINKVSFWVSNTILLQNLLQDRIKTIEKFINVALELKKMNNYNSLMAIIAGLNMAPINRLKQTFNGINPTFNQIFQQLTLLLSPISSFKRYRENLSSVTGPCIPYLGTYLSDLTFTEDGNSDNIPNPTNPSCPFINFSKRDLIYTILMQIELYQQISYRINRVEPIRTILLEVSSFDEKDLYSLSLKVEPRVKQ